jgi:hypothetical protein
VSIREIRVTSSGFATFSPSDAEKELSVSIGGQKMWLKRILIHTD